MRTWRVSIVGLGFFIVAPSLEAQSDAARGRAMPPYRIGWENMRAEAWPEAVRAFQQALDVDPTFELAHYGLGRAHMAQKKYAEAVEALSKCRDMYQAQTGRQFANRQEAQRFRRDNLTELDELIRQTQQMPQTQRMQDTLRQLQERRRLLQESIQRGSNMTIEASVPSFVSLSLGSAFFRLGKLADAEREYKAAISVDPKSGEAHNNLAVVFMETGRLDEAEKSVKAAEQAGYKVHPQLKQDIKDGKKSHGGRSSGS